MQRTFQSLENHFSRSLLWAPHPATIRFRSILELALGFGQRELSKPRPGRWHASAHRHGPESSSMLAARKVFRNDKAFNNQETTIDK
jgi:hypothetical protein